MTEKCTRLSSWPNLVTSLLLLTLLLMLVGEITGQKRVQQQFRTPAPSSGGAGAVLTVPLTNYQVNQNSLVDGRTRFNVDEIALHNHVLRNYHDMIRPAKHTNETVYVVTRIFPMKLQELIEKDEILHLAMRLQFGWVDKRLRWNPANFSELRSIILPGHKVWIPDLQFINSADDMYALLGSRQFAVKVHYNGEVWWHPTGSIKLRCELDLQLFPSVIYTHEQLNLTIRQDKTVSFSMYRENGLWEVTDGYGSSRLNWATSTTAFSRVEFTLHMKRRTGYYVNNYIVPCFLLSCLQVLTFLIPLKNPERLTHATSVLLSLIVFQTIIFSELPKTSPTMPLLARYLMSLSVVSVVAIASCVAVAYLMSVADKYAAKDETAEIPRFLARLLNIKIDEPVNNQINCCPISSSSPSSLSTAQSLLHQHKTNGHIVSRPYQHRIVATMDNNKHHYVTTSTNKNHQPKGKMVTIKLARLYRRLARHLDSFTFFVCGIVILCVPIVLFIIAPSVLLPDDLHLTEGTISDK